MSKDSIIGGIIGFILGGGIGAFISYKITKKKNLNSSEEEIENVRKFYISENDKNISKISKKFDISTKALNKYLLGDDKDINEECAANEKAKEEKYDEETYSNIAGTYGSEGIEESNSKDFEPYLIPKEEYEENSDAYISYNLTYYINTDTLLVTQPSQNDIPDVCKKRITDAINLRTAFEGRDVIYVRNDGEHANYLIREAIDIGSLGQK